MPKAKVFLELLQPGLAIGTDEMLAERVMRARSANSLVMRAVMHGARIGVRQTSRAVGIPTVKASNMFLKMMGLERS